METQQIQKNVAPLTINKKNDDRAVNVNDDINQPEELTDQMIEVNDKMIRENM